MAVDLDTDEGVDLTTRRSLLVAAGAGVAAVACAPAATPPGPAPVAPPPATAPPATVAPLGPVDEARHLVSRATFGATAVTVEQARRMGSAAWLEQQLAPGRLPDAESRLSGFTTLKATDAQNDAVRAQDDERLFAELDHATLLRAVHSERQLYEVMCDFWTNHLNIWRRAKWLSQLKTSDNERVVRAHALGKFADLLMASAKSPAMLVYLDNFVSDGRPGKQVNENYGRELLELHTLGIIDGQHVYGESDVVGVAKVLSGWTINWDNGPNKYNFRFGEWSHSQEAVSILGGAWSRPSRASYQDRVANAQRDGESLIGFLARHPSTARNIATKLARRFVADSPPPALVDRLAATYLANDTAIVPVLRELFLSAEFRGSAGQKVKRPHDWLCSALRATGAQIDPAPKGVASTKLRSATQALGQPLFERVSPDGWPDRAAYWVAADGLLKRWEHAGRLARNDLTPQNAPEKVVVDVTALLPAPLPPTVRALTVAMADTVFQFRLPDLHADAIAAAARLDPAGPAPLLANDLTKLQNVVGLLMSHPEFQRR